MKKSLKKAIAIVLCLSIMGGMLTAFSSISFGAAEAPAGTPVSTVDEFLAMDPNGTYYLANDIDFSAKIYGQNIYTKSFRGTLDGNGHALLGITLNSTNSDAGVFANYFGGTLKNITIGSEEVPARISSTGSGFSVACVAATIMDEATFDQVTLYCDVRGDGKTAGFTCYVAEGGITITNSAVHGNISGNPAAGFLTMSNGGTCNIEIRDSVNYANVTGGNLSAGGLYTISASSTGTRMSNTVITGCVNYGAITATDWRVGGIIGEFNENKSATLEVDYCYNLGTITMNGGGGYAAGIVGGMSFDPPTGKRTVTHCYNAGAVINTANEQRAFAIANADKSTPNCTVEYCAYIDGTPVSNATTTEVKQAANAAELLTIISAYEANERGNRYMADTGKLNEGGYPILTYQSVSHDNLKTYDCGRTECLDCGKILSDASNENHTYVDNPVAPDGYQDGYLESECSACHTKTIRKGTASTYAVTPVDGVYPIDSADDLMWYATNLNAGLLNGNEKLALTADLDLTGKTVLPIGNKKNPFVGSFDGTYHAIKNMKIENDEVAALFGTVGKGATLENVNFFDATVSSKGNAGVLVGEVVSGAAFKIARIAIANATVTANSAAGSLVGSTAYASEVTINACVAQNVTITGGTVGGFLGLADNTAMKNCYVNATLSSPNNATGSLAYSSGRFDVTFCGYVRNQFTAVPNGSTVSEKLFADGKVAYLINSYENNYVFGVENGVTVLSDNASRLVRLGANTVYTGNCLTTDKISLYAAKTDSGVSLAIVLSRSAGIKMTDYEIKVTSGGKTETVKFSDLTLTRYMEAGEGYVTVNTVDTILYTVTLDGVALDATYEIGTLFSGNASTIQ